MLQIHEGIGEDTLRLKASQLHDRLGGPTLFSVEGRKAEPVFISVLMHGNETVGWEAARQLILNYRDRQIELPRSIELFVGNTGAAFRNVRHLEGQPDYNRVWPGTENPPSSEGQMMQSIVDAMARRQVFASIDIHNNTGLNPHYACVNRLCEEDLALASLFGRTLVYFTRPLGVQSLAMSEICPAVTLECGKVGQQLGIDHAMEFIDACLHLNVIPSGPHGIGNSELFHTAAVVRVPGNISFGFDAPENMLNFDSRIDHCNFRLMPTDWHLASCANSATPLLSVTDEWGNEVFDQYFRIQDGGIYSRKPLMPSMLTRDVRVIEQDCLCYLMEPIDLGSQKLIRRR